MFKGFVKYMVGAIVTIVWASLITFLVVAAVPGAVFYADVWTGWLWTSGIAAVLVFAMGMGAIGEAIDR